MTFYQDFKKELRYRMSMTIEIVKKEFSGLRTGRASPAILNQVVVEAYGTAIPLNQLATVSVSEARLIVVQVWDQHMVRIVEKSIRDAGLGLNPISEGQNVRVPIPPLNEERRVELVKIAHRYAEQARVSIRNVRRDGMDNLKKIEKDSNVSQDQYHQYYQDIQATTNEYIKQIDELLTLKEKEIMQI